jgi:hypothetical protein
LSPSKFIEVNCSDDREEILLELEQSMLDIPSVDKKEIISGKKSDVGVMIFTGCKKKLFAHPESQILLEAPALNNVESEIQKKLILNNDIDESDIRRKVKYHENRPRGRRGFRGEKSLFSIS